jgi:hypothetical protein
LGPASLPSFAARIEGAKKKKKKKSETRTQSVTKVVFDQSLICSHCRHSWFCTPSSSSQEHHSELQSFLELSLLGTTSSSTSSSKRGGSSSSTGASSSVAAAAAASAVRLERRSWLESRMAPELGTVAALNKVCSGLWDY